MNNILKKENRIVLVVAIFCLIFIGVIINYTFSFFAVEKTNSSISAGDDCDT